MNVSCPECKTVYRLPGESAKAGAKLRCSQCGHIFVLPAEKVETDWKPLSFDKGPESDKRDSWQELAPFERQDGAAEKIAEGREDERGEASPFEEGLSFDGSGADAGPFSAHSETADSLELSQRRSSGLGVLLKIVFFAGIGWGCWWMWQNTPYLDGVKSAVMPYVVQYFPELAEPVSMVSQLELRDVRQYQVKNPKLGSLIVIEGKVKNNFSASRGLIKIEASLYDAQEQVLVTQSQLAGVSISSFQLELLDQAELESALNSRLDIVTSNFEVAPANEVPFTVVFRDVPAEATDYRVRIVEAAKPVQAGALVE